MIRDITLGQYFQGNSPIHRLDPRTKIIATILYIVILFVAQNALGMTIAAAALVTVVAVSRVPVSFILRGVKPIFIIIIFTFLLNLFMIPGETLCTIGPLTITHESLRRASFLATRLILLIFGASLLTLTTKPIGLTDGIEKMLSPLRKIGVPAHEIAMMMTIALRFIPTLLEETDKIMKAQQARGADFETGSLLRRAKNLIPIMVPLFISSFRIAQDLAMAMEARCYRGGEGRTRMNAMQMTRLDGLAFAAQVAFAALIIILGH